MRALWLDYQREDPERRRPGAALLVFGAAMALLTFADYFAMAAERDETQAEVDALRGAAPRVTAPAANGTRGAEARNGAVVAPPSAERWEALFASLEAAADETVTLLALQPGDREIQISGEARDFAASVDYVQRLQSAAALANARITQSEVLAENPRRPVRFALIAEWRSLR